MEEFLESATFNLTSNEVLHCIFILSSLQQFPKELLDFIFDDIAETIQNLIYYSFFWEQTLHKK